MTAEMISFGAGVNSVAMTIMLVNNGWHGHIVFADPGAEHPDTYCYLDYFERHWLKPRELQITRISPEMTPELYPPSYRMDILTKCKLNSIVPLLMSRWCTSEYKRRPLDKWAKQNDVETMHIGIAAEESHRARFDDREYPLVDWGIGRDRCKEIIKAEGLTVPPKSGCWICPFQKLSEWRALYDLRPDLFQQAVDLDNAALERCEKGGATRSRASLDLSLGYRW